LSRSSGVRAAMTTSIDTNIIVALWLKSHSANSIASQLLGQVQKHGRLVISAPVYSELMADPARSESQLDRFAADTGISIEWTIEENIWREAGRAYSNYARRRIRSSGGTPRRILADYIIGAHAVVRGYSLLTLNGRDYAAAFPKLTILSM
jgi:predicted nucleic acid-binding protein